MRQSGPFSAITKETTIAALFGPNNISDQQAQGRAGDNETSHSRNAFRPIHNRHNPQDAAL